MSATQPSNPSEIQTSTKPSKRKYVRQPSWGTPVSLRLPPPLREKVDAAAERSGLSKQDFYRLTLEVGMIYWNEVESVAGALYSMGTTPNARAKAQEVFSRYGITPRP